jgi:uncharacterized membrane protein
MTEGIPAGRMRPGSLTARVIALVIGLWYLVAGAWAFVAPASFFVSVATFAPYNEHLLHDVGAFQVGLGLALLLGVAARAALQPALLAVLAASLLHVASHVEDRSFGGRPSDLLILSLFCVLLAAAFFRERVATTAARGTALEPVGEEGR